MNSKKNNIEAAPMRRSEKMISDDFVENYQSTKSIPSIQSPLPMTTTLPVVQQSLPNLHPHNVKLNQKMVSEPTLGGKKKFKKKKNFGYCSNCKEKGHYQRQCKKPIHSYGIICVKKDKDGKIEYLMVRRRNSIGYETFLRGRYKNEVQLNALIDRMTSEEKIKIRENNFDDLWEDLCVVKDTKFYKYGKKKAKTKFEACDIPELFKDTSSPWLLPAWGFPKGRRLNHKESDIDCAIREFVEETNYTKDDFKILNVKPIIETYIATNDIRYVHTYYIAFINKNAKEPFLDNENPNQIAEIGDIAWINLEDALDLIKPYNQEKKDVLLEVDKLVKQIKIN